MFLENKRNISCLRKSVNMFLARHLHVQPPWETGQIQCRARDMSKRFLQKQWRFQGVNCPRIITFLPLFRKQLLTTTTTYSCFLRVERGGGVWRSVDYDECNKSRIALDNFSHEKEEEKSNHSSVILRNIYNHYQSINHFKIIFKKSYKTSI